VYLCGWFSYGKKGVVVGFFIAARSRRKLSISAGSTRFAIWIGLLASGLGQFHFFFGSHYSHIIAAPKIVEKSQKNQENMNKKGKGMGMGMEMGMSMEMEMEKVMG